MRETCNAAEKVPEIGNCDTTARECGASPGHNNSALDTCLSAATCDIGRLAAPDVIYLA